MERSGRMITAVIPAHNEEKYIGKCLSAVKSAAKYVPDSVETIVVANRCSDRQAADEFYYDVR